MPATIKQRVLTHLETLILLLQLHDENPFKIKAFEKALRLVQAAGVPLSTATDYEDLLLIKGIGKRLAEDITAFIHTGVSPSYTQYLSQTPEGLLELLTRVRGLGVKTLRRLWLELGIHSAADLKEACERNQLAELKGLGTARQKQIYQNLLFYLEHKDYRRYHIALPFAEQLQHLCRTHYPHQQVSITGAVRRQSPVVRHIGLVWAQPETVCRDFLVTKLAATDVQTQPKDGYNKITAYVSSYEMTVCIYTCTEAYFGTVLFVTTGSAAFLKIWTKKGYAIPEKSTEAELFHDQQVPFIIPAAREYFSKRDIFMPQPPHLITDSDIKGIIHSHTTRSDGKNSLEEMVTACIARKKEYLVVSDHSKSAAIAHGLHLRDIKAQHQEVDFLNERYAPFKIFKSIECDILLNGDLDYEAEILSLFDLVIASVHLQLDMDKETATRRLLRAIAHPYTHILGHLSGRILLSRKGYPLDYEAVIRACYEQHVAIELNANPLRLDIDWQYLDQLIAMGVKISINPDAHSVSGIDVTQWGVAVAQKAGVTPANNLSSLSLPEFEAYLSAVKQQKALLYGR